MSMAPDKSSWEASGSFPEPPMTEAATVVKMAIEENSRTEISGIHAPEPKNSVGMQVTEVKKTGKYAHLPQELLFSLNGVDYTIPKEPPPNVIFAYLRDSRKGGEAMAFANMFVELVGVEALDALAEYTEMKNSEMKRLMKEMQKRVMGSLELGN